MNYYTTPQEKFLDMKISVIQNPIKIYSIRLGKNRKFNQEGLSTINTYELN